MRSSHLCLVILLVVSSYGFAADGPSPEIKRRVAALNDDGIALYQKGEYVRAIARFEEALRLHSSSSDVRTNLGKAHAAYGLHLVDGAVTVDEGTAALRRALERLNQALLYWKGDGKTHRAIAWCHYELSELPAAERSLTTAATLDPGSFETWRLLGVVREEQQKFEASFEAYSKALAIKPGDRLLTTRLKRARFDRQAIREFRKLKTDRFTIHYPDAVTVATAKSIQAVLDQTIATFVRRWNLSEPKGVVVICYPPGEFSLRTGLHEDVGGAFDGRIRIAFPEELEGGGLGVERVVRHEAIHLLLQSAGARPPRWVDEGVAQFLDGDQRKLWWPRFRQALKKSPNVGVHEREGLFSHADPATWAALYLHSYFFVKHLVEVGGELRIDMVVREVRSGKPWSESFESIYGVSAGELDRRWRRKLIEEPPVKRPNRRP